MATTDWSKAMSPLLEKYRGKPHPLEFKNVYQLVVMVVLSARDSDKNINALAPVFFKKYPSMSSLAKATEEDLYKTISKVRGFRNKTKWLMDLAAAVKMDKNIPMTMEDLVNLPGIGRKSANVILRGAGQPAEGVMVDLHVVRVAPRIGIAKGTDPKKIEQQIMDVIPQKDWGEIGMAISFLGRDTCRPSHPHHHECVVSKYCEYYKANHGVTSKISEKLQPKSAAVSQPKVQKKTKAKQKPETKSAVKNPKAIIKKRPVKKPVSKK